MKSLIHEDIFTSNNVFILIFSYLFFFTGAAFYVDFFLYRVEIHEDIRKERITKRAYKENKSIPSQETLDEFSETYNKNIHQSNATFDSGVLSIEQMANSILKDLGVLKD